MKQITRNPVQRGILLPLVVLLLSLLSVFAVSTGEAFASTNGNSTEQAEKSLQQYVYKEMAGNSYKLEGGGSIQGGELFEDKGDGRFDVKSSTFQELDKKSQQQFVKDLTQKAEETYDPDSSVHQAETPLVEKSTVTSWYKDLSENPGIGSRMLSEMLSQTKPDFIGAQETISPIHPFINIVLGLLAIIMMIALSVTILLDLNYIVVPPFRILVGDQDSGGSQDKGFIRKSLSVSNDAILAVRKAESNESGTGGALAQYMKTRIMGLILLGIALLLLVQGQIWNLVGMLTDAVSGIPFLN